MQNIEISGINYSIKEYLTFSEESDVDMLYEIFPIIDDKRNNNIDESEVVKLLSNKNFRSKGLKLISYMVVDPKISIEKLNELPSGDVINLLINCLTLYMNDFGKRLQKKS